MNMPPIRLYEFGTAARWRKAVIRAIQEDVTLGKTRTIIEPDGVRLHVEALGTSLHQWYAVEVFRSGEKTFVGCRCQAGQNGVPCKHLAKVFLTKKWLPWPEGVTPNPRTDLTWPEEDLVLSAIKKGADTEELRKGSGSVS